MTKMISLRIDESSEVLRVSGSDKHEVEPVNKCDSAKTVESNVKIVPQIWVQELMTRTEEDAGSQVLPVSESPTKNESDYELEEERNAAAIAAMAMITRLQEEKATL
ncbi:UNVERIFIED_CONTAM: hypothetical protein Sindi_0203500 [Sesamum indicum]